MPISSITLDLVVLAMIVACALYYRRRGFVSCILGFVGALVSLFASVTLGNVLAPRLFNALFRQRMVATTTDAIAQYAEPTLRDVLGNVVGYLPGTALDEMATAAGGNLAGVSQDMAATIVDHVIAPVIVPLITVCLFILFFLLFRLVFGLFGKMLRSVNYVPVVGSLNRVLGFVMGIVIALLYAFLIVCVIWLLDAAYGPEQFGQMYFNGSILYRLVQGMNIFIP